MKLFQHRKEGGSGPDAGLLARISGGDSNAEDCLCERYREKILFMVRRKLGFVDEAEDICQEILGSVLQAAREGRIRLLTPYLYRVCSNNVNSYLRKEYRERTVVAGGQDCFDPAVERAADPSVDPLERIIRDEERAKIDSALADLGARERIILKLKYDKEMSSTEIARVLGLSPVAVRKAAERARKKIAGRLSGDT